MTPFQELRFWIRRAGTWERLAAGAAAVVVLTAAVAAFVPDESQSTQGAAEEIAGGQTIGSTGHANTAPTAESIGGTQPGATGGSAGSGSESVASGGSESTAAGTSKAKTATGQECVPPPGSDQGVNDEEIKIAVTLINLVGPAANESLGVPPAEEMEKYSEAVVDAINDSGGVACRRLVAEHYYVNPADQNDARAKCEDIQEAGVFSVVDVGSYNSHPSLVVSCFAQEGIPFWGGAIREKIKDENYPYIFGFTLKNEANRHAVFGLKQRGFFSPASGFEKLGYFYRDCAPEYVTEFEGWLRQAGVSSAQAVSYNMGCPSGVFAPPSSIQSAVVRFQQEGVTHVTFVDADTDFAAFTAFAEQQGYRPKYGVPDNGVVGTSAGPTYSASYENMNNTVAITQYRWGEPNTPGMEPDAATRKCDAIYKENGYPSIYEQQANIGGYICSFLWWFAAGANHAQAAQRDALAAGLQASGSVEFPFPGGPNDFTGGPRVTNGGQFWRPVQFYSSCECWRVIDPKFRRSSFS